VRIGNPEHLAHERRAEPLALPIGMGGEHVEIPVRLAGRVLCEGGAERLELRPTVLGVDDRRALDVDLGSSGRHPSRKRDAVVGAPLRLGRLPSPAQVRRQHRVELEVLDVVRKEPAQQRVVGEGPSRGRRQAPDVVARRQPHGDHRGAR
jgi:hypothetical protein